VWQAYILIRVTDTCVSIRKLIKTIEMKQLKLIFVVVGLKVMYVCYSMRLSTFYKYEHNMKIIKCVFDKRFSLEYVDDQLKVWHGVCYIGGYCCSEEWCVYLQIYIYNLVKGPMQTPNRFLIEITKRLTNFKVLCEVWFKKCKRDRKLNFAWA